MLNYLVGPEYGHVEVTATDHGEAVGELKQGGAGIERHSLLAGRDQTPVLSFGWRSFAKAENAILAMGNRLPSGGLISRHHLQKADPQVDIGAVFYVLRGAAGDLRVAETEIFTAG